MPDRRRKVLVLGGAGFIGRAFSAAAARLGHEVVVFDRRSPDAALLAAGAVTAAAGDAADTDAVLAALRGCDTLVHLAHSTVPGSSMADPADDVLGNVVPTARLASRLQGTGVGLVIYASSGGTVYGEPEAIPVDETAPTRPISSYGLTKLAGEHYVRMFAGLHGFAHRILRFANVYGEGQRHDRGQGVIAALVDHALGGTEFELWGTGEEVRDYVHVSDAVEAALRAWDYAGPETVFNVSTGIGHSVTELVGLVERAAGARVRVRRRPRRPFDVRRSVLSSERLRRETGWRHAVDVEEAVARIVEGRRGR